MGIRQPRTLSVEPEDAPDEAPVVETPPEPPPETPPPAEPPPETPPEEPPPAVEEPAPAEPPAAVSDDEYSDDEWNALTPEAQEAAYREYSDAQEKIATDREEKIAQREKKVKKDLANLEKSRSESDRMHQERMTNLKRIAEEKGVGDEYSKYKKNDRARQKDPATIFSEIEIKDAIPNAKTPQERQINATMKAMTRKTLEAVGEALGPDLKMLSELRQAGENVQQATASQAAWAQSMKAIIDEDGIQVDDSVQRQVGAQLAEEEMTEHGRVMSPTARGATLRRILSEVSGTATTPKSPGKVLQFPKRPSKSALKSKNPPRRPPRTMGSRGGTSGKPEPSQKSILGEIASGVDVPERGYRN